ncbi:hepatitis A virus cellular receptor 1 homolog isoform X2 [Cricetulus griseus]|uniref:Hepatitis A virus cellular receptor 1 homolog isoform X2 n=1 Tax=Cricetulus griseus TaxID=10029 RepID=A0A9J7H7G2_CRIGR|nr:hepatitis A virus cellular receptor 1 homolog isoform X2 [Cricetulus griseus]
MMHLQVFISGLILLLPAFIESFPKVRGVVGHPVTLPCTYSVSHGVSPMCWGRGACFSDKCKDAVILTNGYYVYYERNNRYHLTGKILQGNVSLTIEKVNESDSGLYCCQVEMKQWNVVQTLTISLRIQPGSDPTRNPPTMTKGFYIGIPITLMLLLLVSIMVITIVIISFNNDINDLPLTVNSCYMYINLMILEVQEVVPTPHPQKISTMGLYIGISVSVVLLLLTGILLTISE